MRSDHPVRAFAFGAVAFTLSLSLAGSALAQAQGSGRRGAAAGARDAAAEGAAGGRAAAGPLVDVVVLPVLAPAASAAAARQTERVLAAQVTSLPGLRVRTLDDAARNALSQAACRGDASCVTAHLPQGTDLILDGRLTLQAGSEVLDLRLLDRGHLEGRVSEVLGPKSAEVAGRRLLAPRTPEADLYRRATGGDTRARQILLWRYPDGAWTRALLRTGEGR